MFALVRAGLFAALVAFACLPAQAAPKSFERDDLAEAQLVADTAFTALYAATTLSTRLIDRLRYEAGG